MMNSNNQDSSKASSSSSSSVQLDGFAPAAGSGAGSSSSMSAPMVAMKSSSASAAAAATAGGGGGGGAGLQSIATATTNSKAAATTTSSSTVAAAQTNRTKKRGPQQGPTSTSTTATASVTNGRAAENYDYVEETVVRPLSDVGSNFEPITLPQIQLRLKNLLEQLPKDLPNVPPPNNVDHHDDHTTNDSYYSTIKSFASTLQITIEEYNLLISLVSSATYKWGVDRSGASQQNLAVMSAELQQCQDVISNVVSARLSNVLCPAVDVLIGEVEVVRGERGRGGEDEKANNGRSKNREEEEMNDGSGSVPNAKRIKLNDDRLSLITSSNISNNNITNNSTPHHSNHERRINHYTRPLVDPSYVHLCHCILARNAPLIRHAVATSIHTAHRVIGDYMKAMKKDTSHDAGKGGYY